MTWDWNLFLLLIFANISIRNAFTRNFFRPFANTNLFLLKAAEYEYVTTQNALVSAVNELKQCNEVAVDFEFDRDRFSYGFTLCLIQISGSVNGKGRCWLIDPFQRLKLNVLFIEIFENAQITKIMHSPSEDLRLMQSMGCFVKNIFDTERCSKLLNAEYTSLSNLLKQFLSIDVDKFDQTSNWTKRPLSQSQLKYAAGDVIHLIDLKGKLELEAVAKGRKSWFTEENLWLNNFSMDSNKKNGLPKRDVAHLDDFTLHIVDALADVRDQQAKVSNKPPQWIIPKSVLIALATGEMSVSQLSSTACHPSMKTSTGIDQLQKTVARARAEASERQLSRVVKKRPMLSHPCTTLIASKYKPLQAALAGEFGVNTAKYLLPMNQMVRLAQRELDLRASASPSEVTNAVVDHEVEFDYRKKLFKDFLAKV